MESNALYVSYYFPLTNQIEFPERAALNSLDAVLGMRKDLEISAGMPGEENPASSNDAKFTGRIYVYTENPITEIQRLHLQTAAKKNGNALVVRSSRYATERSEMEKPLAFISHDSRDKEIIAKPLALALQKKMCPVWYDEYSLSVGESLRASIEAGLRNCQKCVFVLTPSFLANGGWAKREYDSIFTRELVEERNVILPIWHGVTRKEVYAYSPMLADRVALMWADGIEMVSAKLEAAIRR